MKIFKDGDLIYHYHDKRLGMVIDAKNYLLTAQKSKRYKIIWLDDHEMEWEWEENVIQYRFDFLQYIKYDLDKES
jgi:hypothetical protein